MFADEARFGRMNRPRPCWAPTGVRPEVAAQLVREYVYLYGAVCPKDGRCVYLIMPASDTACFQIYLDVLSRKYRRQQILLVLDGAPNHQCGLLAVPDNITLLFLPPYSPQLNPKENLWDEIREKIFKNLALKSMDAVRAKLREAVLYIERNPELVKSITTFPYIAKSPTCADWVVRPRQINGLGEKSPLHFFWEVGSGAACEARQLAFGEAHSFGQDDAETIKECGLSRIGLGDATQADLAVGCGR